MVFVPRALFFAVLFFAWAFGLELRLTSPPHRVAKPGEIVTHVFFVDGEGGPYPVSATSSFPILSDLKPVKPPRYLPVTIRVPEDAVEGTVDVLTLRVGDAVAEARTEVAFVPGIAVEVPEKVVYRPPLAFVEVKVKNLGNGVETALVWLLKDEEVLEHQRLDLGPFEEKAIKLAVPKTGSYLVRVRAVRAEKTVEKSFRALRPYRSLTDPFTLVGQAALGYSYPGHAYALSFSLAGDLSDYVSLSLSGAYARGTDPAFSLSLGGEGWAFGLGYAEELYGSASVWRGGLRVDLAAGSGGPWATLDLGYTRGRVRHTLSLAWDEVFTYEFLGFLSNERDSFGYRFYHLPAGGVLEGEVRYGRVLDGYRLDLGYLGRFEPESPYRQTFSLGLGAPWGSAGAFLELSPFSPTDWCVAAAVTTKALFGQESARGSLGVEANPSEVVAEARARLAEDPDLDLTLKAAWRWQEGPWALGELYLELPEPVGGLALGASYDAGRFSAYLEADAETWLASTLASLGARLSYPLESTSLSGRVRFGGGAAYLEAYADAYPFLGSYSLGLSGALPLGGGVLTASAHYSLPSQNAGVSLGARMPLNFVVPEEVVEAFGGRKLAVVRGRVVTDAPFPRLAGIRIAAGPYVAETDADGRFELWLPPGKYRIRLVEGSLPVELVPVDEEFELELKAKEEREVVFRLSVRGRIEGRVEVISEGEVEPPKTRFAVEVIDEEGRSFSFFTREDGSFQVPALRPGIYRVRLLVELLPPGFKPLVSEAVVELAPGETERVVLKVRAPKPEVYRPGEVKLIEVKPEVEVVPPGASPLVFARVEGQPERLVVLWNERVIGELRPSGEEGTWQGRVRLPKEAKGRLQLFLAAYRGQVVEAKLPFFITLDPKAPWGQVLTVPLVKPGTEVPIKVHLFAPAKEVWVEVAGKRYPLKGKDYDWEGSFQVPEDAEGRLLLVVRFVLANGEEGELRRYVLVRKR